MTRPSPLQVLDADMPKWAAGGWKPGDAAGVLAALEEAGYVVVERERVFDEDRFVRAMRIRIDADRYHLEYVAENRRLAKDAMAEYTRLAERSEAAEEVERG